MRSLAYYPNVLTVINTARDGMMDCVTVRGSFYAIFHRLKIHASDLLLLLNYWPNHHWPKQVWGERDTIVYLMLWSFITQPNLVVRKHKIDNDSRVNNG